jgi:hypothetical protein
MRLFHYIAPHVTHIFIPLGASIELVKDKTGITGKTGKGAE